MRKEIDEGGREGRIKEQGEGGGGLRRGREEGD